MCKVIRCDKWHRLHSSAVPDQPCPRVSAVPQVLSTFVLPSCRHHICVELHRPHDCWCQLGLLHPYCSCTMHLHALLPYFRLAERPTATTLAVEEPRTQP